MAVIEKVSVEHPSDREPIAANNVDITAELLYLRDQKMKMEAEIARKDLEISQQNAKIARQDAEIRDLKQKRSDQDIAQCAPALALHIEAPPSIGPKQKSRKQNRCHNPKTDYARPYDNTNIRSHPLYIVSNDSEVLISSIDTLPNLPGPGRALDKLYSYWGNKLEVWMGRVAHKLGYGPHAVANRMNKFDASWVFGMRWSANSSFASGMELLVNYALYGTPITRAIAFQRMEGILDAEYISYESAGMGSRNLRRSLVLRNEKRVISSSPPEVFLGVLYGYLRPTGKEHSKLDDLPKARRSENRSNLTLSERTLRRAMDNLKSMFAEWFFFAAASQLLFQQTIASVPFNNTCAEITALTQISMKVSIELLRRSQLSCLKESKHDACSNHDAIELY